MDKNIEGDEISHAEWFAVISAFVLYLIPLAYILFEGMTDGFWGPESSPDAKERAAQFFALSIATTGALRYVGGRKDYSDYSHRAAYLYILEGLFFVSSFCGGLVAVYDNNPAFIITLFFALVVIVAATFGSLEWTRPETWQEKGLLYVAVVMLIGGLLVSTFSILVSRAWLGVCPPVCKIYSFCDALPVVAGFSFLCVFLTPFILGGYILKINKAKEKENNAKISNSTC